jgi:hypothetical protein
MVAPTNQPVVSSVPLYGPNFLIGQTTNLYQPIKSETWNVVIPNPLIGNEAQAGFAAFTADNVTVTRGVSGNTLANFVGFFEQQYFNEWDVGSLTGQDTLGNAFTTAVLSMGSIYVYNSTAISEAISSGLKVVLSITTGTTPAAILVGAIIQGADPAGSTTLDISTVCRVRTAQTVVGAGVLLDIIKV